MGLLLSASCTGSAQPGTEPSTARTGTSTTSRERRVGSADDTKAAPPSHSGCAGHGRAEKRTGRRVAAGRASWFAASRSPPDPKTVSAAPGGPVAVVSPGSGTVTVFGAGLRRLAVFRDFRSPQLATFTPDGEYLLVTDAAEGTLTSLELARMRVVGRVAVGSGAHHLAVSPNDRRAWVALGESANTIVVVGVADPRHMRVLRRLHPAAQAHDIAFDPDGRTVWVSSASQPYISVYGAASGRLIDTVPAWTRAAACAIRGRARLRDKRLRLLDRGGRSRPSRRSPTRRVALRLVQPCISRSLARNGVGAKWRGHGPAGVYSAPPRPNDGRIGRAIRGGTVALIHAKRRGGTLNPRLTLTNVVARASLEEGRNRQGNRAVRAGCPGKSPGNHGLQHGQVGRREKAADSRR